MLAGAMLIYTVATALSIPIAAGLSLMVGFLLAYSSMWLISHINDRYTRWEESLCRVLVKRGKKEDPPPMGLFRIFYLGCVRLRNLVSSNIRKETCPMTAYEFYWKDLEGREHFLGALPERRKTPDRITEESIKKWGRLIIGEWAMINNFYFIQVEV
jgi:hypothetical protein